jgi:hypothetical protein
MLLIFKETKERLSQFVTSHLPVTLLILEGGSFNVNRAVAEFGGAAESGVKPKGASKPRLSTVVGWSVREGTCIKQEPGHFPFFL